MCTYSGSSSYGKISPDYSGSTRWQHFLDPHTDNIQKPAKSPDYLLGEATQPSECQLSKNIQALGGIGSSSIFLFIKSYISGM